MKGANLFFVLQFFSVVALFVGSNSRQFLVRVERLGKQFLRKSGFLADSPACAALNAISTSTTTPIIIALHRTREASGRDSFPYGRIVRSYSSFVTGVFKYRHVNCQFTLSLWAHVFN